MQIFRSISSASCVCKFARSGRASSLTVRTWCVGVRLWLVKLEKTDHLPSCEAGYRAAVLGQAGAEIIVRLSAEKSDQSRYSVWICRKSLRAWRSGSSRKRRTRSGDWALGLAVLSYWKSRSPGPEDNSVGAPVYPSGFVRIPRQSQRRRLAAMRPVNHGQGGWGWTWRTTLALLVAANSVPVQRSLEAQLDYLSHPLRAISGDLPHSCGNVRIETLDGKPHELVHVNRLKITPNTKLMSWASQWDQLYWAPFVIHHFFLIWKYCHPAGARNFVAWRYFQQTGVHFPNVRIETLDGKTHELVHVNRLKVTPKLFSHPNMHGIRQASRDKAFWLSLFAQKQQHQAHVHRFY